MDFFDLRICVRYLVGIHCELKARHLEICMHVCNESHTVSCLLTNARAHTDSHTHTHIQKCVHSIGINIQAHSATTATVLNR